MIILSSARASKMFVSKTSDNLNEVFVIVFFAIVALIAIAIAKRKGVFALSKSENTIIVNHNAIILSFFLYLLINLFISPLALKLLKALFLKFNVILSSESIVLSSIINVLSYLLVISALALTSYFLLKDQIRYIWKDKRSEPVSSYAADIKIGIIYWFVSFPVVMFCTNFFELSLKFFLGLKELPEQAAVNYLKMAAGHYYFYIVAIISVLVFAPFIEEFLFRGLLQNYFKNLFGIKSGIILSSIFFALFHYSPDQRFSNIMIILSLFVLSLFLGVIYEKQKSLISPIVLHATFNAISIFNLLLIKDP